MKFSSAIVHVYSGGTTQAIKHWEHFWSNFKFFLLATLDQKEKSFPTAGKIHPIYMQRLKSLKIWYFALLKWLKAGKEKKLTSTGAWLFELAGSSEGHRYKSYFLLSSLLSMWIEQNTKNSEISVSACIKDDFYQRWTDNASFEINFKN